MGAMAADDKMDTGAAPAAAEEAVKKPPTPTLEGTSTTLAGWVDGDNWWWWPHRGRVCRALLQAPCLF